MGGFKYDHRPLLAPGRHFATLRDLHDLCVVPFTKSTTRAPLFAALRMFVQEFEQADIPCEMLVNGSFVTAKEEPQDVDLAVLLDPDVTENLNAWQAVLVDQVNDNLNIFIAGVDGFVETLFPIGHTSFRKDGNEILWSEQYGREHNGEYLKGVAVLRLGETNVGLRIRR